MTELAEISDNWKAMIKKLAGRPGGRRPLWMFASSVWYFAIALSCVPAAVGQTFKATVASTTLQGTSFQRWSRDLRYKSTQIYPMSVGALGCPFIDVVLSGVNVSLMLDSGTAKGFMITTSAPEVPHRVEGRVAELNADGTPRGDSSRIRIGAISVLGKIFDDAVGGLSDWKLFSSDPFNGTVGLDFFLDRRLTLDYRSLKIGVTASPLPEKLDRSRYVSVDLIDAPGSQGHVLYTRARVNGREAIIYLDTGYNVSFIDPEFCEGLTRRERPGRFPVFREGVPIELNGNGFILDELRESPIRRGAGFELPVAMALGSDILSRFVVTIDLRAKKLILAVAG